MAEELRREAFGGSPVADLRLAPFFPVGTAVDIEPMEIPYRVRRYDAGYRPGPDAR